MTAPETAAFCCDYATARLERVVSRAMFDVWVHRGHVARCGKDRFGRATYDLYQLERYVLSLSH